MAYRSFLRVEFPRPPFCLFPPTPPLYSLPPPRISSPFSYSRYFQLIQLTPSRPFTPARIAPVPSNPSWFLFSHSLRVALPLHFPSFFLNFFLPFTISLSAFPPCSRPTYPLSRLLFFFPLTIRRLLPLFSFFLTAALFLSCSIALFPLHTPYNFLYMPDCRVSSTSLSRCHLCPSTSSPLYERLENKKTSKMFGDFLSLVFSVVSTFPPTEIARIS